MTPGEDPSRGVSSFPHEIPHKRSQRNIGVLASVVYMAEQHDLRQVLERIISEQREPVVAKIR